jgi:hypothetical protein
VDRLAVDEHRLVVVQAQGADLALLEGEAAAAGDVGDGQLQRLGVELAGGQVDQPRPVDQLALGRNDRHRHLPIGGDAAQGGSHGGGHLDAGGAADDQHVGTHVGAHVGAHGRPLLSLLCGYAGSGVGVGFADGGARLLGEAAEQGGDGVREQLVRGRLRVGEPFDGEPVRQGDQGRGDLVPRAGERGAQVAGDAVDDAADEGPEAGVALGKLGRGHLVADGLVPEVHQQQHGVALLLEHYHKPARRLQRLGSLAERSVGGLVDPGQAGVDALFHQHQEQVFFAVEVGVDGAVGVAGLGGDRRDRGAPQPLAGEDPRGGVQQLGPGPLALFVAPQPARTGRFRWGHLG